MHDLLILLIKQDIFACRHNGVPKLSFNAINNKKKTPRISVVKQNLLKSRFWSLKLELTKKIGIYYDILIIFIRFDS